MPDRIRSAYETAKAALLAEMVSMPVAADDPVQKLLDAPVGEMRHWVGELSTSALSTATAIMALEQMRRQYVSAGRDVPETWTRLIRGGGEWLIAHQNADGGWGDTVKSISNISTTMLCHAVLYAVGQVSNLPGQSPPIKLEMSGIDGQVENLPHVVAAKAYIDRAGGVKAVIARYGKDRTFSVPILTHCALAGLVEWDEVISLPFELACIPAKFYAAVRLPVVSYALPALIAIGQVRFHFRPSWNPLRRWLQRWARPASLRVLERIQPPNGGFLEATPLTSFVTMSLAAMGLIDHPVTRRGVEFIVASARWGDAPPPTELASVVPRPLHYDNATDEPRRSAEARETPRQARWGKSDRACSWPIDTNLATWVTTLSINALGDDVPLDARPGLRAWLLRQQYRVVHPYTNAAPGGWAWTDLPGGVPDADDTPGAMLALMNLERSKRDQSGWHALSEAKGVETSDAPTSHALPDGQGVPPADAVKPEPVPHKWYERKTYPYSYGIRWLVSLQNRDGGIPTFCRGWGTLPFDRSSPDLTAHVVRALSQALILRDERGSLEKTLSGNVYHVDWKYGAETNYRKFLFSAAQSVQRCIEFLRKSQRPDGSWLPLWFGNQHAPNDENPTYGTAKVLAAFQALGRMSDESAVRGVRWLVENQNPDGGWGAGPGTPSSVEETALALEALLGQCSHHVPRDKPRASASGTLPATSATDGPAVSETPGFNSEKAHHVERDGYVETAISLGLSWLIPRVEDGRFREPAPIGFYFAKLWYFEALYPLIFTVAALRKATAITNQSD